MRRYGIVSLVILPLCLALAVPWFSSGDAGADEPQEKKSQLKWVELSKFSNRKQSYINEGGCSHAKIRGGWLVQCWNAVAEGSSGGLAHGTAVGLTFIPDPKHENPPTPVP